MTDFVLAATGHRPNKLGGYSEHAYKILHAVAMSKLAHLSPRLVISGMALGWDTAVAEAALDLGIPLHAAVPFKGQENAWPHPSREKFNCILDMAQSVRIVCDGGYAPWKMQKRNEYMVDSANIVLALWDGSPGGTANCVAYAEKTGVAVKNVYNTWKTFNESV